jgi:HEAT repeat protein
MKGLAALRDKRAVDPISQLLLDEDEAVREAAREALTSLRKKRDSNK